MAGSLAGVYFGLVFGGMLGKWLDKVFGPEEDGEGKPAPADAFPSSKESFTRLHAAGWLFGEVHDLTPAGPRWRVTGANGENVTDATGETQAEAWHRAAGQARSYDMLGAAGSSLTAALRGRLTGQFSERPCGLRPKDSFTTPA